METAKSIVAQAFGYKKGFIPVIGIKPISSSIGNIKTFIYQRFQRLCAESVQIKIQKPPNKEHC